MRETKAWREREDLQTGPQLREVLLDVGPRDDRDDVGGGLLGRQLLESSRCRLFFSPLLF